jgi:hypothetical protein
LNPTQDENFAEKGDSGSLVILFSLKNNIILRPIGILHSVVDEFGRKSLASPLDKKFFNYLVENHQIEFDTNKLELAYFNGDGYFKINQ